MRRKWPNIISGMTIMTALSQGPANALPSYPGCSDLQAKDFQMTELFNKSAANGVNAFDANLQEPIQMDFHAVRKAGGIDHIDIFFVERLGKVKHFDGATRQISVAATLNVLGKIDNGLMGLALHPDFDTNHWMFLWYCPNKLVGQNRILRLSRFTVDGDNHLNMASEKTIIEILGSKSDAYHSGGPMTFDAYGDLWVTVGSNSWELDPASCNVLSTTDSTQSAEWGPSNTASLRGGIFRIHPDSSNKGYSVPEGNFGDYWAKQWEAQGKTALAAEYRDTLKVLPEVYSKGDRSNFSISVHPTKRWLTWSVVNFAITFDEFNLVTHPVFSGYPYFHANNVPTCVDMPKSAATPKNNNPLHSGVVDLPPATPGVINNLVNVSISGPIYVFDPSLDSKTKFPPHLHQSWFQMGFTSGMQYFSTLDTVNVSVLKTERVDQNLFSAWKLRGPLQAKYGPDGSLYVLNYDGFYSTINPGIFRMDYVGNCHVPITKTRPPGPQNRKPDFSLNGDLLSVHWPGKHAVSLFSLSGRRLGYREGQAAREYSLSELVGQKHLDPGVYMLEVRTLNGRFIQRISRL